MVGPEDASYAEIWINALLEFIKHIDNCIPNFINLIALPWNGEQYLSSFPPAAPAAMFNRTFPR